MRALLTVSVLAALASWGLEARAESPQNWAFELKFGPYLPDVDNEFKNGETPFNDIFGPDDRMMTKLEFDFQYLHWPGSLGVGASFGFAQMVGKGRLARTGAESDDTTVLNIFPLSLDVLVYRFDLLARMYSIPIVPFFKGGLDYYFWWVTDGVGDVSSYQNDRNGQTEDGFGGIFGYHFSVGGQFLLDILDPTTAKTFDVEIGVNHTYIFFEWTFAFINNFHQGDMDLSDSTFLIGLVLEI